MGRIVAAVLQRAYQAHMEETGLNSNSSWLVGVYFMHFRWIWVIRCCNNSSWLTVYSGLLEFTSWSREGCILHNPLHSHTCHHFQLVVWPRLVRQHERLPWPLFSLEIQLFLWRDCLLRCAVHGSAWVLNTSATALEKGRAADRRHVILGRSHVHRAVSHWADPSLVDVSGLAWRWYFTFPMRNPLFVESIVFWFSFFFGPSWTSGSLWQHVTMVRSRLPGWERLAGSSAWSAPWCWTRRTGNLPRWKMQPWLCWRSSAWRLRSHWILRKHWSLLQILRVRS